MKPNKSAAAVILAGGKGTRSANPNLAKVIQEICGKSLISYHLDLLDKSPITKVFVVGGHLSDQVEKELTTISHDLELTFIKEREQAGTLSALATAAEYSNEDDFLVILGDILCSFDIELFLKEWKSSQKDVAVVVHPSTHPEDSDKAYIDATGKSVVTPKGESLTASPNSSSAGIFGLNRHSLERYHSAKDIGSDVLTLAANDDSLFIWNDSHYFKDTGTSTRLDNARADVQNGVFSTRGNLQKRRGVFLDRDGVINPTKPEFYEASQYHLLPGVAESILEFNKLGVPVFILTNQPGIAKGFMTPESHQEIIAKLDSLLAASGAFCDEYLFCPHHPEKGFESEIVALKIHCLCRKPLTGMAIDIERRHGVDLATSIMVGDTWRDFDMAKNANMHFVHVSNGNCELEEPHECFLNSELALSQLIRNFSK